MKKLVTIAMSSFLALTLVGCGQSTEKTQGNEQTTSTYPEKPITIVAPSGAGGGWDITAREVSKVLSETKIVEQTLMVENKPGGGGAVFLAEYATQDKNNDYKLFINSPPILINNNKAEGNSPYGYADTTPLAQLTRDYGAIVVAADSPYQDLTSLLEATKKDPTAITFAGGSAPGSMDHLVSVLPAYKYGMDPKTIKYVSYDGGGEAIAALLGGNADAIATDASAVGEYLKAGKIKVLAVSSPERLEGVLADVPTFKEAGIDAEFLIWRGIFGPKDMSEEAKAFWEEKLGNLSQDEVWLETLTANGWGSDYKNSVDFKSFLEEQDGQIKELLTALGMLKK